MIVVADSGSTKTNWIILKGEDQFSFNTKGINPLFLDENEVAEDIRTHFPESINIDDVKELHFYGPGCSTAERAVIVEQPLKRCFRNAQLKVETDLLGAARALFQRERGIACILGTGSNSGLYDGERIVENIPSTGFILGDEGSGANLGLELVKKYINHELEKETEVLFYENYQLSIAQIIDKVYKQPYPNRFLASFALFISENIEMPSVRQIAEKSFAEFIERHILPYPNASKEPIAFVGSIAFYFSDLIEEIANQKGITISKIDQKPIEALARYHKH